MLVAEGVGATVATDLREVLKASDTNGMIISSTRPQHFNHVRHTIKADVHGFVEKPMVTKEGSFRDILTMMKSEPNIPTLDLNHIYPWLVESLRSDPECPVFSVNYTIAERLIPPDHWLEEYGARGRPKVTEAEHFIDIHHLPIDREPISAPPERWACAATIGAGCATSP